MKKNMFRMSGVSGIFIAMASFALLLSGCAKSDEGDVPQMDGERTVRVSVTKEVDTKTAVVEGQDKASYFWTSGDETRFRVYENNVAGTINDVAFSPDMKTATLSVTFSSSTATEYVYKAMLASSFSNSKNPKLEAGQSPASSSYDPTADILVSETVIKDVAASSLQFRMSRKVTVNKMTLKGLHPGEKISKVEFEHSKELAGYYNLADDNYTGSEKKLTLNFNNAVIGDDGTFPVYFTCFPVSGRIANVVVTTDKTIYTKPSGAFTRDITFALGRMSRFNMDMTGYDVPLSTDVTYKLVESTADLVDGGIYIVAGAKHDVAMGALDGTIHQKVDITKSTDGKSITVPNTIAVLPVKLKKNGTYWTMQNILQTDENYGKYIAWSSGNSSTEQATAYNLNISVTNGIASVTSVATSGRKLLYNASSPRFCFYTSSQAGISLYIREGAAPTPGAPVINADPTSFSLSNSASSQTINYTITNPTAGVSLNATANVAWITNIDCSTSGKVTFDVPAQVAGAGSRVGTITLDYDGAADVEIAVTQAAGEGGDQPSGWLELPAGTSGSDYITKSYRVGSARNYTHLYQYSTYTSLWTAYPLYSSTMGSSTASMAPYPMAYSEEVNTKGQTWVATPGIDKALQVNVWSGSYGVSLANPPYVSDLYARGHQIPNSDRSANGSMQSQTYYATNSTPQIQNRFNGYIWNNLETNVRASVKDTVYVVTGATFRKAGGSETITYITPQHDSGKSVPVPNYYWKVLLKVKRSGSTITSATAIGFWFEHKQYNSNDFKPYAVSVSQIETWTGFNFFVHLPDAFKASAMSNTDWSAFYSF